MESSEGVSVVIKLLAVCGIFVLLIRQTPANINNSVQPTAEEITLAEQVTQETQAPLQVPNIVEVEAVKTETEPKPEPVPTDPKSLAKQKAEAKGWHGTQWEALEELWHRESGWNPNAKNPHSAACGIPQAWPCSKIPDPSSVESQIEWGIDYIAERYSTPAKALAHWKARVPINGRDMGHWY